MTIEQPINFKQLFEQFSESSDFNVEIICGPAPPHGIDELENDILSVLEEFETDPSSFHLPTAIKEQFCLYNKLFIRWSKPGSSIMGFMSFPHLMEMIESKTEVEGKTLYLFDDFQDMWKVYIELDSVNKTHKLYFRDLYEKTNMPMCIDVGTYYKKLAMCRGLTNWQEFFFEDKNYESNEGLKAEFEEYLKSIFPEISLNEFKTI